jgi:nucleotide-binding universal stress UspA family protein
MSEHILVGVDGSAPSLMAVDLASYEASRRGCPLLVVHVGSSPERLVQAAVERAAAAEPDIKVTGEVLTGATVSVLVEASSEAVLTVVGHRGAGGFAELLVGSVSAQLAAHAHGPVIVVRGRAGSPGSPGGDQVVVGVDGSADGDAAIGFAFAEADRRAAEVLAIHAVTGAQFSGPSDALIYDRRSEEARAVALLYHAVAKWHEQFPDLLVQRRVRWAPPAETLVKASTSARLVVVGRRGTGGFLGLRLGSVVHALLHHSACPVAVVPGVA